MPLNLEEIYNNQTELFMIKRPGSYDFEHECRLMLISKQSYYDYDLIAFIMPNSNYQVLTLSYDRANKRFFENELKGSWIIELDDGVTGNTGRGYVLKGGKKSKKRKISVNKQEKENKCSVHYRSISIMKTKPSGYVMYIIIAYLHIPCLLRFTLA
jgi:hypothetical protein